MVKASAGIQGCRRKYMLNPVSGQILPASHAFSNRPAPDSGSAPPSVHSRPAGSANAVSPVFVPRAIQRRCSTARMSERYRCWAGAELLPYQPSLLMLSNTCAPAAT